MIDTAAWRKALDECGIELDVGVPLLLDEIDWLRAEILHLQTHSYPIVVVNRHEPRTETWADAVEVDE